MAKKTTIAGKSSHQMTRPPIVTIIGHVDHGKTTLLDTIRKSHLTTKEHGGITQHIGAYQIEHEGKKITFIDTPGHAAFAKMRARGAKVTDIIVLVIAATEGVKPQTVESINHIKSAGVPFIVALNKIDLPEADPVKAKSELAKYDILVEEFGGKVPVVEVSAKSGKNIPQLLEMIDLVADLAELQANPEGNVDAVVIESNLDKHRGPIGNVIIKNGTIKVGQTLYLFETPFKVRSLVNDRGQTTESAEPGAPVNIAGFKTTPPVGATLTTTPSAEVIEEVTPPIQPAKVETEEDIDALLADEEKPKRPSINILLKTDVQGTLEAIKSNLTEEVILVGEGVGDINESDVLLAASGHATIIAFNVKPTTSAKMLAETEKVVIKTYQVIYELLEDLEKQILKLLEPTIDEEELGIAEIVTLFNIKNQKIAGCKVKVGEIKKGDTLHLKRGETIISDTKIKSLKQGKIDVDKVGKGSECGLIFSDPLNFAPGDLVTAFKKVNN